MKIRSNGRILTLVFALVLILPLISINVFANTSNEMNDTANPGDLSALLVTVEDASIRLENPNGLRFATKLDATVKANILATLGEDAIVGMGTLIAPLSYVEAADAFTKEALEALEIEVGDKYLDVPFQEFFEGAAGVAFADGEEVFTASIVDLHENHLTTDFAAIGYASIKLADGTVSTYYASSYAVANASDTAKKVIANEPAGLTKAQTALLNMYAATSNDYCWDAWANELYETTLEGATFFTGMSYEGLKLTVNGPAEGFTVYHNGTFFVSVDGVVTIDALSAPEDTFGWPSFAILDAGEYSIYIESPIGSWDNPIEITDLSQALTASVPEDAQVYYVWYADRDGILTVTSATENGRITVENSDSSQQEWIEGIGSASVLFSEGDMIRFTVGTVMDEDTWISPAGDVTISFAVEDLTVIENIDADQNASVPENGTVYYKWEANGTGILAVTSTSDAGRFYVANGGFYAVLEGAGSAAIPYDYGNEIIIRVSTVTGAAGEVAFELSTEDAEAIQIPEDTTQSITFGGEIGAGEYAIYTGSMALNGKIFTLETAENISVWYNGEQIYAEDGVITFEIYADDFSPCTFVIKNEGEEAATAVVTLAAPPLGTMNNPIVLEDISAPITVDVDEDKTVYYKWVAPEAGVLTVTNSTAIGCINVHSDFFYETVEGEGSVSVPYMLGDVIIIEVSTAFSMDSFTCPAGAVTFSLETAAAEMIQPPMMPGQSATFGKTLAYGEYAVYAIHPRTIFGFQGKTVTIADEEGLVVYYNNEYVSDDDGDGMISFTIIPDSNYNCVFIFKNNFEEWDMVEDLPIHKDLTFEAVIADPMGSMNNPDTLDLTDTVVTTLSDGSYFYTWTAETAGTFTFKVNAESNWVFCINNPTAGAYGDNHTSGDEPLVNTETVTVAAGDVLQIVLGTLDWSAAEITFEASFVAAETEA